MNKACFVVDSVCSFCNTHYIHKHSVWSGGGAHGGSRNRRLGGTQEMRCTTLFVFVGCLLALCCVIVLCVRVNIYIERGGEI